MKIDLYVVSFAFYEEEFDETDEDERDEARGRQGIYY
jgi:hypothetical protein